MIFRTNFGVLAQCVLLNQIIISIETFLTGSSLVCFEVNRWKLMINCFYYVTFQIDTVVVLVAFLLMTIYFNFQGTTSSTEITLRWWIMGSLTHLHLQPNRLHPTKPTTIKIKTNKTTIAMPTFQEQPVSFSLKNGSKKPIHFRYF